MPISRSPGTALRHAALLGAFAALAYGCDRGGADRPAAAGTADRAEGTAAAAQIAFRNTGDSIPAAWADSAVFQLSHDYPTANPGPCPVSTCAWLAPTFDGLFETASFADWSPYLDAILAYVVEGQTSDLNNQTGWRTSVGGETRWFHVPWMAYDTFSGREFVHGTTNERTATLSNFLNRTLLAVAPPHAPAARLAASAPARGAQVRVGVNALPGQTGDTLFQTWAVGMYNPWGGWAIGQAVPADGVPRAAASSGNTTMPVRFPLGTVVAKVLFSTASPARVPYLAGSPRWTVNGHVTPTDTTRVLQPVHLVQMDVAVRDDRSPMGWVYGTYAYRAGAAPGSPWYRRMVPVGVQWGSDPQSWPAVDSAVSRPLAESAINPAVVGWQHLGCEQRLAGPVDNPASSCLSCHGGAAVPSPVGVEGTQGVNIPPIFGYKVDGVSAMCVRTATSSATADSMNTAYFSNLSAYPSAYPPFPGVSGSTINLDTSLQLWVAYLQYASWASTQSPGGRRP